MRKKKQSIDDLYNEAEIEFDIGSTNFTMDYNGICYNKDGEIIPNPLINKSSFRDSPKHGISKIADDKLYRKAVKEIQLMFLRAYVSNGYCVSIALKNTGINAVTFNHWMRKDKVFSRTISIVDGNYRNYLIDKQREHIEKGNYEALKTELVARIPEVYDRNTIDINDIASEIGVTFYNENPAT